MKKLLLLSLTILLFSCGDNNEDNDETANPVIDNPIPNAKFQEAINACLETNPVDGLCTSNEYGIMPNWNVSQVTDMESAFQFKNNFIGDISSWDVSNVTNMHNMFYQANSFNGDISFWDVGRVNSMNGMFEDAISFNDDISSWDVSNLTNIGSMFYGASSFNQNLSSWNVGNVSNCNYFDSLTPNWNKPKPNFSINCD
jgi:surface protein